MTQPNEATRVQAILRVCQRRQGQLASAAGHATTLSLPAAVTVLNETLAALSQADAADDLSAERSLLAQIVSGYSHIANALALDLGAVIEVNSADLGRWYDGRAGDMLGIALLREAQAELSEALRERAGAEVELLARASYAALRWIAAVRGDLGDLSPARDFAASMQRIRP